MSETPPIVIIGAGIGGLALAHGLTKAGISVAVFERDASARARRQDCRIGVKEAGVAALRDCLPYDLYALAVAAALRPPVRMVFLNERLEPTLDKPISPGGPEQGFAIQLRTLREVLLARLGDCVHFGRAFAGYEHQRDGRVGVSFADGERVTADLLVGADGTHSAVRAQLLPGTGVEDLGWVIHGRTPIAQGMLVWMPDVLVDTVNRVNGQQGAAMSVTTCRPREPLEAAAARLAPDVQLTPVRDALQWTVTPGGPERPADPVALHDLAFRTVRPWHRALRQILTEADVQATAGLTVHSAASVSPWEQDGVTLMGDAIHAMSPGRGEGPTVTLQDAQLLCDTIVTATRARRPLARAVHDYEVRMLRYGLNAVARSKSAPVR